MDQLEIEIDENRVATFDGRVLEVFGGEVRRFHVRLLTVVVPGPDKRGTRNVQLQHSQRIASLPVDELAFDRILPILDALKQAGVSITAG
jgi:hypothetical protein